MTIKRRATLLLPVLAAGMATKAFAGEVKINNDLAVESDGTLRFDNDATVWDDLRVPMTAAKKGKTVPEEKNFPYNENELGSVRLDWFRPSGIDEMFFVVQMPHAWAEGTDIKPHVHWTPSQDGAVDATEVKWGLDYSWLNLGDAHTGYSTISGSSIVPNGTTMVSKDGHYITPLNTVNGVTGKTIVGTGKKISSMLICRIYRDGDHGDDTFAGKAGALEVDFHYQIDTMGSREEYSKYPLPV